MWRPRVIRVAILAIATCAGPAFGQAQLTPHQTRYYVLHTDLGDDIVREAEARITAMAEMYYARTKDFGGDITKRMPFYLYSRADDYYAAGGMPGSAGVFDGRRLMAIAGEQISPATWCIIQHEGFHQFAHAFIGGDIPVWANEGLAEYFAQSIYTGDGFVCGVVPPERLTRLQGWIKDGRARSIEKMMTTSYAAWSADLDVVNYDQAWSMVHFLAHGDGGRYQRAFGNFLEDVSRGMKYEHAWKNSFGAGTDAFERKWRGYWLGMTAAATAERYVEATVATLTSFHARALSQKQVFESFEAFHEAARAGRLQQHREDWLPPSLLESALARVPECGEWSIRKRGGRFAMICTMDDGTTLTGTYKVRNRRVVPGSVKVVVK
jgi:hypothetical protein